jgi:hypothetical protein
LCPHIVITKPCTDLCQKCQEFAGKISKSGNITEEEKELLLQFMVIFLNVYFQKVNIKKYAHTKILLS